MYIACGGAALPIITDSFGGVRNPADQGADCQPDTDAGKGSDKVL